MPGGNGTDPVAADRFIPCTWTCGACGEHGTARPWKRPGETAPAAVERFASETRGRCVKGCAFTAAPAPVLVGPAGAIAAIGRCDDGA